MDEYIPLGDTYDVLIIFIISMKEKAIQNPIFRILVVYLNFLANQRKSKDRKYFLSTKRDVQMIECECNYKNVKNVSKTNFEILKT